MASDTVIAGYACYDTGGYGLVYALTSTSAPATPSPPVVLMSAASKAQDFFPFLFLVVGGAFTLLLLILVSITFCCRHQVTRLEATYWQLQHANAELNKALVQEVLHHTHAEAPKRRPSMKRKGSTTSKRSQKAPQMQRYNTTNSMRQSAPQAPNSNAWGVTSNVSSFRFPAVPSSEFDLKYGDVDVASSGAPAASPFAYLAPISSPQQQQQQATEYATTPEFMRRRDSKVRFLQ